jgi:hypothetical protein
VHPSQLSIVQALLLKGVSNISDNNMAAENIQRYIRINIFIKSKAVPLYTMEALGGRRGIPPTHSQHRYQMGVSGQRHAPATLYRQGKDPRYPLDRRLEEKCFCLCRGSNLDRPVIQSVVKYYTELPGALNLFILGIYNMG